jgi:hypothetical protein
MPAKTELRDQINESVAWTLRRMQVKIDDLGWIKFKYNVINIPYRERWQGRT